LKSIKNETITRPLSALLYILVLLCLIGSVFSSDLASVGFCVLTLLSFSAEVICEYRFKIYFSPFIRLLIQFFIFSALILGEMCFLYGRVKIWDVILHFTSGFILGAVGVSLFVRLNKKTIEETGLSPAFLVIAVIGFSVFVGVIWEFFEFLCDNSFQTDMQKDSFIDSIYSITLDSRGKNHTAKINGIDSFSVKGRIYEGGYLDIGLIDTMKDMAVNFAGAIVFGIILLIHTNKKNRFTAFFIKEKTS